MLNYGFWVSGWKTPWKGEGRAKVGTVFVWGVLVVAQWVFWCVAGYVGYEGLFERRDVPEAFVYVEEFVGEYFVVDVMSVCV